MSAMLVLFIFLLLSGIVLTTGFAYIFMSETVIINKIVMSFGVLIGLLVLYADAAYILPLI